MGLGESGVEGGVENPVQLFMFKRDGAIIGCTGVHCIEPLVDIGNTADDHYGERDGGQKSQQSGLMGFAECNIEGLVDIFERFGVMDFEATGREMLR